MPCVSFHPFFKCWLLSSTLLHDWLRPAVQKLATGRSCLPGDSGCRGRPARVQKALFPWASLPAPSRTGLPLQISQASPSFLCGPAHCIPAKASLSKSNQLLCRGLGEGRGKSVLNGHSLFCQKKRFLHMDTGDGRTAM